jgi:hypothetical protein
MIKIKPCGVSYWLLTFSQLPFSAAFTWYIIYAKSKKQDVHDQEDGKVGTILSFTVYYESRDKI